MSRRAAAPQPTQHPTPRVSGTTRQEFVLAALRRSPLLGALPPDALAILAGRMRPQTLPAGALLFSQGDPGDAFYLVERGRLRLFRTTPDGHERTLAYLGPGEVLGEMALLGRLPRSASVEAALPCTLWRLDGESLVDLVQHTPAAALSLIGLLARRLAEADRQLEEGAGGGIVRRVAGALLRLARRAPGEPALPGSAPAEVRLTHQELAHLVGATRESVTRALARLHRGGAVVSRRRGRLLVIPDALAAVAAGDLPPTHRAPANRDPVPDTAAMGGPYPVPTRKPVQGKEPLHRVRSSMPGGHPMDRPPG